VERQAESARETLAEFDAPVEIETVHVDENVPSKGTAVTLVGDAGTRLGGSALGERGKPAEEVGAEAAKKLVTAIESDADTDEYTADQLVPYVALAGGRYDVPEITSHLETNIHVCEEILECDLVIGDELYVTRQ
jgi:RNA 3'-terminal phosphate cyclase (GTP)